MSKVERPKTTLFAERVDSALDDLRIAHAQALRCGTKPPVLSVSGLMKRSGISKSALYEDHPDLLQRIEGVLTELKNDEIAHRPSLNLTSVPIRSASKEQWKKDLAKLASVKLSDMIAQSGPFFRERSRLIRERNVHLRRIEELEAKVSRLSGLVDAQMEIIEQNQARLTKAQSKRSVKVK